MLMLTGKVYDRAKQMVQVWIPAFSTLYFTLGSIWGLPAVEQVIGTLAALATFLGVILGVSSKSYYGKNDPYAGDLIYAQDDEGATLRFAWNDDQALDTVGEKDTITFKVVKRPIDAN